MKVGDIIKFYVFGVLETGTIVEKHNEDKTVTIVVKGTRYPHVMSFKRLPKRKSQIPPWYILK